MKPRDSGYFSPPAATIPARPGPISPRADSRPSQSPTGRPCGAQKNPQWRCIHDRNDEVVGSRSPSSLPGTRRGIDRGAIRSAVTQSRERNRLCSPSAALCFPSRLCAKSRPRSRCALRRWLGVTVGHWLATELISRLISKPPVRAAVAVRDRPSRCAPSRRRRIPTHVSALVQIDVLDPCPV